MDRKEEELDPKLATQAPARIQLMAWLEKGVRNEWPAYWCPVCKHPHTLDARWKWNGSFDKPTFSAAYPGARFSFICYHTRPAGDYYLLKRNGKYCCVPGTTDPVEFMSPVHAQDYADARKHENNGEGWGVVPRKRGGEQRVIHCHVYVKDGMIQILHDTPGPLANKTLPLDVWSWKAYQLTGKPL